MNSRATSLIRMAGALAVAFGALAGCGKGAYVEPTNIVNTNPCTTSGNGYYTPSPYNCSPAGGSYYNNTPTQGGTALPINVPTGTVVGKVIDSQTNLGLPGATVQIIGVTNVRGYDGSVQNVTTTTDAGGNYTLSFVPEGRQTLDVSKPDYIYLRSTGTITVSVVAGTTTTAPTLSMTPARLTQANGFVTAFSNFKHPRGIRLDKDGNNMYVVDIQGAGNIIWPDWAEVKQLNATGGLVNKFGGISLSDLGNFANLQNIVHWLKAPYGVGADPGGNIYVADSGHNEIKQYAAGGKYLNTIKRNFKQVYDIAVMPNGNIVVSDPASGKITLFTSGFSVLTDNLASGNGTLGFGSTPGFSGNPTTSPTPDPNASSGLASGGKFQGIAVDNGNNIYVVDAAGAPGLVVRKFDERGTPLSFAGSSGFGTIGGSQAAHFENPTGIAVDNRNGDIYVVDSGNNRVQRFDAEGRYLDYFGGFGTANGMFSTPIGVAVDKDGSIYVTDYNNGRVQKFGPGRPANGF